MKNVLILGAVSDIAQALAHKYGQEGYSLTLAARKASRLDEAVTDLQIRYRVPVQAVEFDALAFDGHAGFYASLAPQPDVVIVVFGYLGEQKKAEHDFAEAKAIIDTNYTGVVSILNIVANDFERRRAGTIIGISSVAGDRGRGSNYVYGSAKAGFTAYLSGLRNRLAKAGVHVLTVKPGFVRTKMTAGLPLPGPVTARPEQVAADVFKADRGKANQVYSLWMWRYVMLIIRHIPEPIFKRMSL
ncbi:MAG TPA: SDR family oxidoreductase [Anaerolineae bacterium]|nr:SDR family oxidoreductase [Anaerolineae bacterium]HMR64638.1 SDR family oxidoreductase [Anaerolineae bacterium]